MDQPAHDEAPGRRVLDQDHPWLPGASRACLPSTSLVGPLIGAGLFTVLGGPTVALLNALSFLLGAAAFSLIRVREAAPARRPRRNWTAETAEGIRYLWRHRTLRALVIAGGCAMAASSLSSTATYALLDTGLRQPAAFAGVLSSAQGLGSVIGGLAAGALMRRVPARLLSVLGLTLFALGAPARITGFLPMVVAGGLLIGAGLPWPLISALTTVQKETPDELLGRVAATANTLVFAPTGLAILAGTALVATLDYRVQLLAAGVLGLTTAVLLAVTGRPHAESPTGPSTHHRPPEANATKRGRTMQDVPRRDRGGSGGAGGPAVSGPRGGAVARAGAAPWCQVPGRRLYQVTGSAWRP
ncbi:MFS transporter [Streptomyces sp. NPDC101181]|uniref:MFS transporter n=1 Tax=Streptomyces sp. NPDC101181 TaxID=3366125 RepID=UPI0037F39DC1